MHPPLYHTRFARGFGTLYDAAFYPASRRCEYFWPEQSWRFDFDSFTPAEYRIDFIDPEGAPIVGKAYDEVYTAKPVPALQF